MAQHVESMETSLETTDDGNEDKEIQPQIYAKESLDRFGDDLCALLLSYLSTKDRFRYECVSKQFQRNIYKSVVTFKLNDKLIRKMPERYYPQMLATITTKCPNIEIIDCRRLESSRLSSQTTN
ncbi:unnamed protein product [Medioppia subpectinata]|uniref:F-box domain-containing protein n=1 Tax=Medioppia subpectinata TaxID=1979941 RepID=A0A7R9KTY5_9ACAR|nr:unnamed protein product [Medioppia subpectinata]CAG2109462.1 unnamed protein product [Medioppia subpectinata]